MASGLVYAGLLSGFANITTGSAQVLALAEKIAMEQQSDILDRSEAAC